MFLQMGIQSADSCETCITIFAFEGFCIAMNTATMSRDFTPSKSDQSSTLERLKVRVQRLRFNSSQKMITILELNFSLQIEQENIFFGSLLVGMSELFKLPFSCNTTSEFEFPFIMSLRSKRAFFGEFL